MQGLTMPPVSEAQRKWAWANKNKGGKEGAAAKEFADADKGGKLPAKKKKSPLYDHARSKQND